MAYIKKTWSLDTFHKGDTAFISGLNHIEAGVDQSAEKTHIGFINISTDWSGSAATTYTQTIVVTGAAITENSKVDMQATATLVNQMNADSCKALYIENDAGVLTLHAVGSPLTVAQSNVQVSVSEVAQ